MNYLCVVSDSHGRRGRLESLLPEINGADTFVFLGDCSGDIYFLRNKITVPQVIVSGNCDLIKAYPEEEVLEWRGHRFYITHGHKHRVKSDLTVITYAAKEKNCDCVLFGHTHEALAEKSDGIWLINPGSIAEGRCSLPSYCVVTEEKGNIFPKIISFTA